MTEDRRHEIPLVPSSRLWPHGLEALEPLAFPSSSPTSRRRFLRYLAASPLMAPLAASGCASGGSGDPTARLATSDAASPNPLALSAEDVLDIPELEELARRALPPAHFGYIATGVSGDETLRANREGFSHYFLRARRLVDLTTVDSSIELFGRRWDTPIVLAPAGSQRAFHPQGEMAVARAARTQDHLQILSTVTTSSVEDVTEARGAPIWYQLYPTSNWDITQRMIARAEAAGCEALVLTVDLQAGGPRDTLERARRADDRDCTRCHDGPENPPYARKPMFDGFQPRDVGSLSPRTMTWEFARRVRDATSMRFLIKGIVTREDTHLAVENGVDGVIVSNHGGRGEESGRATIDSLPEVVRAAAGRVPVLVDGGFRRGNDVFKALALGATAICIGRPYLWGLAAFGEDGVARVLQLLTAELHTAMRQAGVTRISDIGADSIGRA